jgi:hypothetical protein
MAPEATTEPKASSLSDAILSYRVQPFEDTAFQPKDQEIDDLSLFQSACLYIAVAQIFLYALCIVPA